MLGTWNSHPQLHHELVERRNRNMKILHTADGFFNQALDCAAACDYEQAVKLYSEAIRLDPTYVQAYNNRGNCYYRLADYKKAIDDFSEAIKLNADKTNAYSNRANCFKEIGKFEEALFDLNKAIELDPCYAKAYNNRGHLNYTMGKFEDALDDYNRAISMDSQYETAHLNRANVLFDMKKYDEAIRDYSFILSFYPRDYDVLSKRGECYLQIRRYEKAITDWENAISINSALEKPLRRRINEAKSATGIDAGIGPAEKVYEVDDFLVRLYATHRESNNKPIDLRHEQFQPEQLSEMANILMSTSTKLKTHISQRELRELLLKVRRSEKKLTDKQLDEIIELIMVHRRSEEMHPVKSDQMASGVPKNEIHDSSTSGSVTTSFRSSEGVHWRTWIVSGAVLGGIIGLFHFHEAWELVVSAVVGGIAGAGFPWYSRWLLSVALPNEKEGKS
jgi:tetratricopeptide (TPR) repeat protein